MGVRFGHRGVLPLAVVSAVCTSALLSPVASAAELTENGEGKADKCNSVLFIGDSNTFSSLGKFMGDDGWEGTMKEAGYDVTMNASPARSMKEEVPAPADADDPSAYENATDTMKNLGRDLGKGDCLVSWMGTNDAANVSVANPDPGKASEEMRNRIQGIMDTVDDDVRVLWSEIAVGEGKDSPNGYTPEGAERFDKALHDVAKENDNLEISPWLDKVDQDWFIDDGVHYTVDGYKELIATVMDSLANGGDKVSGDDGSDSGKKSSRDNDDESDSSKDDDSGKSDRKSKSDSADDQSKSDSRSSSDEGSEDVGDSGGGIVKKVVL